MSYLKFQGSCSFSII